MTDPVEISIIDTDVLGDWVPLKDSGPNCKKEIDSEADTEEEVL